jgi:hypothetical protein
VNPAAAGAALGTTSLQPTGDGSGLTGITSVQIGGLGTAATQPSTAFDVSGAATTAQSTAQAFTTSSISALGLDTASTKAAVTSLATPGVDTNVPTEKATRTAIAAAQAAAIAAAAAGNAATASALAATPSLCSTGQSPTGVLPNGNATGCATAGGASSPATLSLYKGNNSVNGIVAAVPNTDYLPVASPTMTGAPTINGNKIAAVRVATLPTSCTVGTDGAVVFATGGTDAVYACDSTSHYAIPPGGSTTVLAGDAAGAGGSNKVLTTNGVSFGNLATQSAPASGLVGSNGTALGAATGAQINTALGFTPQNAATANANNDALGAATTAQTAAIAASAQKSANGSDFANAATVRTNLGLGTAATQPSTAFDVSGAATTAQAASAQKSANGSDFANVATVRTNLGLGTISTLAAPAGTVVGTTDTQTLTGKTFNTGAIGNVLQIAGLGITSTSGNVGKVATASGALTSGNMPKFDGFGNVIDSGVPASAFSTNGVSNSIVTYSGPTAFSGTQFLPLAGGSSFSATESEVQSASPTAAAVTNMQVHVSVAPGAGNSIAFTWRKAGVSQVLTCTISGASATSCSDLTHSFNAAQGDLLDVQMVTTGTIPSSPFLVVSTQYGTGGSALQVPGAGGIVKSISSGAGTAVATPDTDFQSAIVVNPIASYGCVADGVFDDTACLVNMHNALFAIQAADTTNTVSFIIQSPAGKHYTYTNNRFLWGLRHVRLDWNGSSLQCLNTDGQNIDEYPLNQNRDSFSTEIFAHFPFTVSALNYGYLIQTANPGDTSVTTITPADSANFTVGRWVLVDSYDQEFGGYPPNARYFDYAKVTAINTSTGLITLDRGVTALHSSDYPEFITTPANGTGRARIVNIDRSDVPFCESLELNNIVFRPNPVLAVATTQYTLIANTYQATINGGSIQSFVPTMSHDVVVSHATIAQSEPDKLLDHVRYDSVTMGDALGGSGAKSIEVAGGSIAGPVFFNPRLLQLTGVRLNGPTNNSVAGNSSVFGSNIFLTPNRTEMRSNIFNGKNHYGDVVVAQPQSLPLTVDGITVTITNNYTVSGLMSNGAVQNFLGCAEVGSIVNVVAPTPLTTPITGIVQAIHGGTGAPQIDILFSGTVGANYVINCTAMQSLLLQSNKYYNFVNGSNGVAFNTNIVTPWVPNLNWENNVTGGGTKQVWKFNTFYGGGQLLNIYGYITKITVNVLKPYSGATASPGLTINKLTSSTGGTFSEAVNLATAGVREFSVGYYSGAVTGDIPTALTSNLYEQVIQLIINGKTQLAGTQDQQAIYTVTIETSNPFAEYY